MGNIPVKYLVYGAVAAFAVCFIMFIWSLLLCIFKTKSLKFDGKKNAVIVSICCVVVALASWVLNIGWLRFVLSIMLVPLIYGAMFLTTNVFAAKYSKKSTLLKWCNLLYMATYILANVLYPDVSGTVEGVGDVYFLFGLVKNTSYTITIQNVAGVIVILHGLLFIVQLVLICMSKNTDEDVVVKKEVQQDTETTEDVTE